MQADKRSILIFTIALALLIFVQDSNAVTQYRASVSPNFFDLENPDATAEFTLEIQNLESEDKIFRITQIDPNWIIQTQPHSHWTSGIPVPAKSTVFTKLLVHSNNIDTGRYKILLQIRPSGGNPQVTQELIIGVPEPSSRIYQPSIRTELIVPETADPREPLSFDIKLQNQNPLDVRQLKIEIVSTSPNAQGLFSEERITTLSPIGQSGDTKTVTITRDLDERMSPRNETIRIKLIYENEVIEPAVEPKTIEITGFSEIKVTETTEKSFLKKTRVWTYVNDGNIPDSKDVVLPISWHEKMFSKVSQGIDFEEDDEGKRYVYGMTLKPDEKNTFMVTTNYRLPFFAVIALILLILGYFLFRSPLLIYKEAREVHKRRDGHTDIKVQLRVKNRSAMTLEEVRIIDKVSSIAELDKIFHIGTLEPSKITGHEKSGTVMKWEIDEIDRFEERLIVYTIHTKLAVVGGLRLPAFTVKFKTARGDIRRVKSKPLHIKF